MDDQIKTENELCRKMIIIESNEHKSDQAHRIMGYYFFVKSRATHLCAAMLSCCNERKIGSKERYEL